MAKIPSTLESNNPAVFPSVFANEVGGHKTVATLAELYKIPDTILSKSKTNEKNDAIGQEWYVASERKRYQLVNWAQRKTEEGWILKPSGAGEIISEGGEIFNDYFGSTALGQHSHTEGCENHATGHNAHAEGNGNLSAGDSSHSEGYNQVYETPAQVMVLYADRLEKTIETDKDFEINEIFVAPQDPNDGWFTFNQAYRVVGHVGGNKKKLILDRPFHLPPGRAYRFAKSTGVAFGHNSHTEGEGTFAINDNEHAQGQFNKSSDGTIDSVGIGKDVKDEYGKTISIERKNATETKFNGDHYIIGIGGYDGTNPDTAKSVQTVIAEMMAEIEELKKGGGVTPPPTQKVTDAVMLHNGNYIRLHNGTYLKFHDGTPPPQPTGKVTDAVMLHDGNPLKTHEEKYLKTH